MNIYCLRKLRYFKKSNDGAKIQNRRAKCKNYVHTHVYIHVYITSIFPCF